MAPWSLETYCKAQAPLNLETVVPSTRLFLESLKENVSTLHPFCLSNAPPFQLNGVPPMGPLEHRFEDQTYPQAAYTIWKLIAPPLLAMGELWLRLFSALLAPLGIAYMVWILLLGDAAADKAVAVKKSRTNHLLTILVCALSLASSLVLATDMWYVHQYGSDYGVSMLVTSSLLATLC